MGLPFLVVLVPQDMTVVDSNTKVELWRLPTLN